MNKKSELVIVFALYLFAVYIWTLPIQVNSMPFGDVDAPNHFTYADYMGQNDKPILTLPYYLTTTIAKDTGGYLGYPPQYIFSVAIMQIFTKERFLSPYLLYAIVSTLFILANYLLIRKLYGMPPALLSSFFLIFSYRDYMQYLWGLWPQVAGFGFIALIIYSFYMYIENKLDKSAGENKNKLFNKYAVLTIILLAFQYCFHQQSIFFTIAILIIYSLIIMFKNKRIIFNWKESLFYLALLFILIIILAPFQITLVTNKLGLGSEKSYSELGTFGIKDVSRLFSWFKKPAVNPGVSDDYLTYTGTYKGYWTIPFLLIGLLFIFIRRKNQDLMLISWLIVLYFFIHLDVFGLARYERFLEIEARLFMPLMAIGIFNIFYLLSPFVKLDEHLKRIAVYFLAAIFVIMVLIFNAGQASAEIKDSYPDLARITPVQLKAIQWLGENTPEDAYIHVVGPITPTKKKWVKAFSHRTVYYDYSLFSDLAPNANMTTYLYIDYSDYYSIGRQDIVGAMQQWEKQNFIDQNKTLLYNQDLIRIYKK